MKILYGIQGTGNGHIRRAQEILAHLKKYGEIDLLLSGSQSELAFSEPVKFRKSGLTFISHAGGIDILRSIRGLRIRQFARDISSLPLKEYNLIISDYEPITGWASYFQNKFCVGLSNQVSFFSPNIPRPRRKNIFIEYMLKNFVPCSHKIGFHYESYDKFIETPIIAREIREQLPSDQGHITVYLPAYDPNFLKDFFKQIPEIQWHIFSKNINEEIQDHNVRIIPIGDRYTASLLTAHGLITAAGFQATAEALYLGKKLFVIPHRWQYEQECNAAALANLGIKTLRKIDRSFIGHLNDWLYNAHIIKINYPDNIALIVEKIIKAYNEHIH